MGAGLPCVAMTQRLALVVVALLLAPGASALAQERSRSPKPVRAITLELKQLVDTGYRQSHTFRSIVENLVGSFVTVHIVPATSLPTGFLGGLQFVTTANGYRYLRISMRTDLKQAVLIATLGHELQHALEIGQAAHVVDLGTLRDYYRLTGIESCLDSRHECYDTPLAQTTGQSVYAEVSCPEITPYGEAKQPGSANRRSKVAAGQGCPMPAQAAYTPRSP